MPSASDEKKQFHKIQQLLLEKLKFQINQRVEHLRFQKGYLDFLKFYFTVSRGIMCYIIYLLRAVYQTSHT